MVFALFFFIYFFLSYLLKLNFTLLWQGAYCLMKNICEQRREYDNVIFDFKFIGRVEDVGENEH